MDSMETTRMGSAHYASETYAFIFWIIMAIAGTSIAWIAWTFVLITRVRLRAKAQRNRAPASTTSLFTIVSILREASYRQSKIPYIGLLPNNGCILFSAGYISILLGCLLSDIWAPKPIFWEAIALRSGYLCVAQLPLLIALSTKKNIIAMLTCTSHERIIVFHRLVALAMLVTATLHMGYFLREWLYYDVWKSQWQEMGISMLQWGFAAWGIMIFILVTSLPPIRARFYELWICVHIMSMIALIAMVYMHLDPPYKGWIYATIAIWGSDRVWRFASRVYLNIDLRRGSHQAQAIVEAMTGNVTKVTVKNFSLRRFSGQYAYLSLYSLGMNSHPFTIVSLPDSPNLVFMMKAKNGLTHLLHKKASSQLPPFIGSYMCSIEGPYGGSHTALQAFDTVILIAGGIGATFMISLLNNIVRNPGCCRRARVIWAVKSASDLTWFSEELALCTRLARQNNLSLAIEIYVTCDEGYVSMQPQTESKKSCGNTSCRCRTIVSRPESEEFVPQPNQIAVLEKSGAAETVSEKKTSLRSGTSNKGCCCSQKSPSKEIPTQSQYSGRPNLYDILSKDLNQARGESGIYVCGPESMTLDTRKVVVQLSDDRAVKKGTGAEAIYLHVENQSSI